MINLSEISSSNPLVILRGEYGVVKGENALIAAPSIKHGMVLILTDETNHITAMAQFDDEKNLEKNFQKILNDLIASGADIKNLKCNLVSKAHE